MLRVVPASAVDYVTSSGPYAELHAGPDVHVVRETMRSLEDRLDPGRFFRVHRSTIVQLDRVEAVLTAPGGDYAVRLRGRDAARREPVAAGRTRAPARARRAGRRVSLGWRRPPAGPWNAGRQGCRV